MAKIPRIAVVGSANIDLTTFTDRFPKPGETIFGQKFDLGFGGKGANQATAAKLCGASVFMVARVGSDLFGPATIENFKKLGIDTTTSSRWKACPAVWRRYLSSPAGKTASSWSKARTTN